MSGTFAASGDPPVDWVEYWTAIMKTNDLVNANTGRFDPRHMYGVTNQDVFRWPAIVNGTERQLLGFFITTLVLPGIPTLTWGEEQGFYLLDSTAANYVFGRSPISSSQAWQMHGCYKVGNSKYFEFPTDSAIYGCEDEAVTLDHRDPSSPIRNIVKSAYEMRKNYPVLNDGYSLQPLSKQTHNIFLPGSNGTPTETGIWSIARASFDGVQPLRQTVWLVFNNEQQKTTFHFDCKNASSALLAPFAAESKIKNMFFPYDEYTLQGPVERAQGNDSKSLSGCLSTFEMPAWGFKAFIPLDEFVMPSPVITKFVPGHDNRIQSTAAQGNTIPFEVHFSAAMDCDQITSTLQITSKTVDNQTASLNKDSVRCGDVSGLDSDISSLVGAINTTWTYNATLVNVSEGIHQLTVKNISTADGGNYTKSTDSFMIRIGQPGNPIVFPKSANYSSSLLFVDHQKNYYISHKASGADQFRYSLNFGTTYSDWQDYGNGENTTLAPKVWSGTDAQGWNGEHVIVQYWSRLAGSSNHIQHGDVNSPARRFPHMFVQGPFNQYGFDAGLASEMEQSSDGTWTFDFMNEWPARVSLNVWGMNPDGQPDQTKIYGDIDGDFVLDRIPPQSLIQNTINITTAPPSPFLAHRISVNDADLRYQLIPIGSRWNQLALYILLWCVPILTGIAAIWAFMKSFYQVKFNEIGVTQKAVLVPLAVRRKFQRFGEHFHDSLHKEQKMMQLDHPHPVHSAMALVTPNAGIALAGEGLALQSDPSAGAPGAGSRRTVLIATMEYDIEDWNIKIKIGGLGVMAQLMGKNLAHQDLIWVVPCVGGVDYPIDEPADTILVTILGNPYEIGVQYHVLRNITYVLLDAPVFRQQTKSEPYPPRMDDLDSAIYYSAWNASIAEVMKRFPVDLYHINDYHGAVAPLHLLPDVIPCVLSLHNAEFQGLWPMRSPSERDEVCKVYNLDPAVVQRYVQFGEVFSKRVPLFPVSH